MKREFHCFHERLSTLRTSLKLISPLRMSWPPYQNASAYTENTANWLKPKPRPEAWARAYTAACPRHGQSMLNSPL